MNYLKSVFPVKLLLALTASALLWMGAFSSVHAHTLLLAESCTLAIHGIPLTITISGPDAGVACELRKSRLQGLGWCLEGACDGERGR